MLLWIVLAAFCFGGVMMWMRSSQSISVDQARTYLTSGALLVDVRSPGEFNSGHLRNARNVPLDQLETIAPGALKDKDQVLLLHCQSGMRSRVAQRKLQQMGYSSAFNVGAYSRAAQVLN